MVCDLHSHYPMHLVPGFDHAAYELVTSRRARAHLLDRARAGLVDIAGRVGNYESISSGPRVTVAKLREGRVGVALSVLYSPFDEMDLALRYGSPPEGRYFHTLVRQLDSVEAEVAANHGGQAAVARNPAELDAAIAAGTVALVHCVEGAFHVGATPAATNAPAIPCLPDPVYRLLFPQPDVGLAELGRAAVRACVRERVLVDVSHMTATRCATPWSCSTSSTRPARSR